MALSKNPDYLLRLVCEEQDVDVLANIPEQFMMSVTSSWENRLPSSLQDVRGVSGSIIGGAANFANLNVTFQWLTQQTWISSSPIELNLTLQFDALTSAYDDVVAPMKKLQKLVLPYRKFPEIDLLMPPGPSAADPNKAKTYLRIGRLAYFHNVIVVSVNNTYDTRYNKGYPISGQSEVVVRTIVMPTREDLDFIL